MKNNGETVPVPSHESHVSKTSGFTENRPVGEERHVDCSNIQNSLVGHMEDSTRTKALDSQGEGHKGLDLSHITIKKKRIIEPDPS